VPARTAPVDRRAVPNNAAALACRRNGDRIAELRSYRCFSLRVPQGVPRRQFRLEHVLARFRSRRGLYLLGAGASAGDVPLDPLKQIVLQYLREAGGFPIQPTKHAPLDLLAIAAGWDLTDADVYPDRPLRPGTPHTDFKWRLRRVPGLFIRRATMAAFAEASWRRRRTHSYTVFRAFHPSLILCYNHDGLAIELCGPQHRVRDLHHSVHPAYGSPDAKQALPRLVDHHVPADPDGIPLLEPETTEHERAMAALLEAERYPADFIAIVGYSFWRKGDKQLDGPSLDWLTPRLRNFCGPVYVIDPYPDHVCGLVENASRSVRAIGVPAYWNVLAHAMVRMMRWQNADRSLDYVSQRLIDRFGGPVSFPIDEG